MARYEGSTQQRNWIFTVEQLAEKRAKCIQDTLRALDEREIKNKELGIEGKPKPPGISDEERTEYGLHCLRLLSQICIEMKYPNEVLLTSAMYFKRFLLTTSVMRVDPVKVLLVCIYIAGKCEEVPLSRERRGIDAAKLAKSCALKESDIKELEVVVLNGIKFNLVAFHPLRPMIGFVRLIIPATLSRKVQSSVEDAAKLLIFQSLYTDALFLYSPSQIALAAVHMAIAKQNSPELNKLFNDYIETKFGENVESLKAIQDKMTEIETVIEAGARDINSVVLKAANKKAKKCRTYLRKMKVDESVTGTKRKEPPSDKA